MKRVEQVTLKKSEFVPWDEAKYGIEIIKNKKGKIKKLHITHKLYPLYNKGFDNYEELNIKLTKLIKYIEVEMYYIREDWNGTGYFPICRTKMQISDEFFNFVIDDSDVRKTVLELFKQLKEVIESSGKENQCYDATYYFPL